MGMESRTENGGSAGVVSGKGPRGANKPTIADVARFAGVSVATVSYVLNNRLNEVSAQTADKVLLAVQELGYIKNLSAAALTGQKTKLIAVIIPGISDQEDLDDINPFYGAFIFSLERALRSKGYGLCVHGGREKEYVNFLIQRGVETAILVGLSGIELPSALEKNHIRFILYDSFHDHPLDNQVRTNEIKGGYLAAERLIDIGKRRIVFTGQVANENGDVIAMRHRGASMACDMAETNPLLTLPTDISFEGGYNAAAKLVDMKADGVVTPADIVAAGVCAGLLDLGVRIPEDIGVIGYDNLPISRSVRPQLSTIDQGLGEKVKAVMAMIESDTEGQISVVDPRIVLRQSA